MIVLGIETSCDETAAAVVNAATRQILAQTVYSQLKEHAPYAGVVPEIASRAHLERLPALVAQTLAGSGLAPTQLDAVAATTGPGLTTALVIGSTFAKTLALSLSKPFLAVNHIEAHALSPFLATNLPKPEAPASPELQRGEQRGRRGAQAAPLTFPYLLLLVSGGHCQLVMVEGVGRYTVLGTTLDDAVGECFDKVGKLLGLPHPAGPAIEVLAQKGRPGTVSLPTPQTKNPLDFSFSGLKTAVKDYLAATPKAHHPNLAASFQAVVAQTLARKAALALGQTKARHLVAAGGVAANQTIRAALQDAAEQQNATFTAPPLALCTDNAVMIAYAAGQRAMARLSTGTLATAPRPRWPLQEMST